MEKVHLPGQRKRFKKKSLLCRKANQIKLPLFSKPQKSSFHNLYFWIIPKKWSNMKKHNREGSHPRIPDKYVEYRHWPFKKRGIH